MTMPNWLTQFISPAGILLLFGGVVWGVQLNIAVMSLTGTVKQQEIRIKEISKQDQETIQMMIKTTAILDNLTRRFEKVENVLETHEGWKHRIIRLEENMHDKP